MLLPALGPADVELENFEIKVVPPMDETITLEQGLTFCRSVIPQPGAVSTTVAVATAAKHHAQSVRLLQVQMVQQPNSHSLQAMFIWRLCVRAPHLFFYPFLTLQESEDGHHW